MSCISLRRLSAVVLSISALLPSLVQAQAPAAGKEPPPAETATTATKDGVQLTLTYLPSAVGKEAVPVVLLHMFKGNRRDVEGLGLSLQKKGFAVVMPDLRGHGDSTTVAGFDRRLDAATMPIVQFQNMITQDMEAVKKFVLDKHNAGALNIEKLCVVGAEMSVLVAVNWAAHDWAAPDLPALKQSKDVKALVLISPMMAFKNLNMAKALSFEPIRDRVAFFLIAGAEDTTGAADARRIHQQLERARPKPSKIEDKTVFLEDTLKTKLVGTKLLGEKSLGVEEVIAEFIELRCGSLTTLPWKARVAP